jgi:phosphoglycolate phosphatase
MTNIRGIVFDCDGVLFESRQANLVFYNTVLAHFGRPPVREDDRETCHLCHTAASPQVLAGLFGEEMAEEALAFSTTLDYRNFIPYMTPEPEMTWALAKLSARYPLAVATNRGTSMPEILSHFDLSSHFSAVVTSRDVPRPKPHPDMLHLAARRLGFQEDELLFVGDSELDRRAALAAGMPFAAYRWNGGELRVDGYRELVGMLLAEASIQNQGARRTG